MLCEVIFFWYFTFALNLINFEEIKMPRRKMVGRRAGGASTLASKIKDLKKQIKLLKVQTKKVKQQAQDEAYRKAMSEIIREIEKRDAVRTKAIKAAEAKFEKEYDAALAKKAKVKKRGTTARRARPTKDEKAAAVKANSNASSRRGRPKKVSEAA